MVFIQCSILNRDSPDVDENKSPFGWQRTERIEFSTDLHYLGLLKHALV